MQNPTPPGALTREGFIEQAFHTGTLPADNTGKSPSANPSDVVAFWSEAGPSRWFAKDEAFDRRFRDTFMDAHWPPAVASWTTGSARPAARWPWSCCLISIRAMPFRGTPRMYASDAAALRLAEAVIAAGHDRHIDADLRLFVYLPFAHWSRSAHQERCVALCRELGGEISPMPKAIATS